MSAPIARRHRGFTFEQTGQMEWKDLNGDGRIQYRGPQHRQPNGSPLVQI